MHLARVPSHIGIIPDGNRRFAKRLLEAPFKGHEWGIEKIKTVFEWCKEMGIKVMTVYALSLENLTKRPQEELSMLFALAKKELTDVLESRDNFVHRNRIRMRFFGRTDLLPQDLQNCIANVSEATKGYNDYFINMAIAYGGRQELVDACRAIGSAVARGQLKPQDIDEAVLRHNLSTNGHPDPDLVIRTGSEKRLSNFLIFQTAYSELVFLDTYWPELTKEEFARAIKDFSDRERRFGS